MIRVWLSDKAESSKGNVQDMIFITLNIILKIENKELIGVFSESLLDYHWLDFSIDPL